MAAHAFLSYFVTGKRGIANKAMGVQMCVQTKSEGWKDNISKYCSELKIYVHFV